MSGGAPSGGGSASISAGEPGTATAGTAAGGSAGEGASAGSDIGGGSTDGAPGNEAGAGGLGGAPIDFGEPTNVGTFGCFIRSGDGGDLLPDGSIAVNVTNPVYSAACVTEAQ